MYFPSILVHFTDVSKEQHPGEYGGAVGWWVVVGVTKDKRPRQR